MNTFKVARLYQRPEKRRLIIETGFTIAEARAHCADPNHNSHSATTGEGAQHTREHGHWLDQFYREDPRGW